MKTYTMNSVLSGFLCSIKYLRFIHIVRVIATDPFPLLYDVSLYDYITLYFYFPLSMGYYEKLLYSCACNFTAYMDRYFCMVSPGGGFADRRVDVSFDLVESANFSKVVLPVYSLTSSSCCSTFLPAFDIIIFKDFIIFKYLAKFVGL